MTQHHRKLTREIRTRMEKTGETFSTARMHVIGHGDSALPSNSTLRPSLRDSTETGWHRLIETTPEEAKRLLEVALAKEPHLTYAGIGLYETRQESIRARLVFSGERFERERAELHEHLEEIAACADWIKLQTRIKTFNRSRSSYGYKHNVEYWIDRRGGPHCYVSNGSFIAAAVGLGYETRATQDTVHNVYFQFSKRTTRNT